MFDLLLGGLESILTFKALLMIIIGASIGLIFGVIPGLGPTVAATLLISFTYSMDPAMSMILIASVYVSATFGGSQTAILYNIPGSAENACTTIDGYRMTKKGQVSDALGAAIYASFLGGLLGCLILIFFTPYLAKVSYLFGAYDYLAFALFGLAAVIGMQKSVIKGTISALIGITVGMIGISPIDGSAVLTFGSSELYGGIKLIPVMLGMYAVAEVFHQAHANFKEEFHFDEKIKIKAPSAKIIGKIKYVVLRSSIIGVLIGILPGVGAVLANYIGYSVEEKVQSASTKHEKKIGTGDVRGVAAPEAANNAAAVATFIPMLALGIPGGAVTAILLGVFEVHGIQAGPLLFSTNADLVYTLFMGLLLINIFIIAIGYIEIKGIQRLLHVPKGIIFPVMLVFAVVGSFVVANSFVDVLIMLLFGIIGITLKENGFSVPIMILGIVLGDILESNFARLILSNFRFVDCFTHPIGLSFMLLSIAFLIFPMIRRMRKKA